MRASSERPIDRPSTADEYTYSYAVGLSFALSHRHFIALSLSPSCLLFLWQTFFSGTSSKYICPVRCVHFRTLELYGLFGCFFISHLFFPLSLSISFGLFFKFSAGFYVRCLISFQLLCVVCAHFNSERAFCVKLFYRSVLFFARASSP